MTTYYIPLAQSIKTQEYFQVKNLTDDRLPKDYVRFTNRTRFDTFYFSSPIRTRLSYELFFLDYPERVNWHEYEYGIMTIKGDERCFIPVWPEGDWFDEQIKGWSKIKE